MAYFTLQFRNATNDVLYESDFTLHELIPLVRHTMRSLANEPELVANPTGYRAFLEPRYDEMPARAAAAMAREPEPAPRLSPVEDGSPLHLSEEDIDVYAPVSYLDEAEAYYNPGTSSLCPQCPERLRCPGSGQAAAGDLTGWIELDPAAMRSNERVTYFVLRIETTEGRVIHKSEVGVPRLQHFLYVVLVLLNDARRPVRGTQRIAIIARYEGQPKIDPVLRSSVRRPVTFRDRAVRTATGTEPPRRLVDWDRVEEPAPAVPQAPSAGNDPIDLEIKVFPSESDPLPRRPPPAGKPLEGTRMGPEDLPVYVHRSVLAAIDNQRRNIGGDAGGVLIGDAVLDPETGKPYVEVVAALAAGDTNGVDTRLALDSRLLREVQDRIERDYPGRRTVGWYQFHLPRVAVGTSGSLLTMSVVSEPLEMVADEIFLHRNFFPQPWHLGLVIDALEGDVRFYCLKDGEIAITSNFQVVG